MTPISGPVLILVVDDNETGLYTKTRILRSAGFEVVQAKNGKHALRLVDELRPRLVVLDVQLPDVDGWEVCRRIKADPQTASVLVLQLSATFVAGEDTVKALEGGADGCLTEPVEATVLVATVRSLLRARAAEVSLRETLEREQDARAVADAANRAKDEFLATLSHELRSPLGTILTWATLLKSSDLPAPKRKRALEAIERNARIQLKLIEDLLDVSRIVSGKMRLDLSMVEPEAVLEAALDSVRHAAQAKSITIERTLETNVAPLMGDATRLQQVLWNLLSNAVKFTPRGGRIEIAIANSSSQAEIRVTDSGRGIAPEYLPHVFERFHQVDASTTRSAGGLGLGLAIVRHLVELHGGTVEAESEGLDRGSTFRVRLPLPPATPQPAVATTPTASRTAPSPWASLEGLRVLLVDDENDAREAISMVVRQCGADVSSAGSVSEAMENLEQSVPDILVSDIAMPLEDGYSLIRRVRSRPAERGGSIPAIAVTAYGSPQDQAQIVAAGFDAYLRKPIDISALIGTISKLAGANHVQLPPTPEVRQAVASREPS